MFGLAFVLLCRDCLIVFELLNESFGIGFILFSQPHVRLVIPPLRKL